MNYKNSEIFDQEKQCLVESSVIMMLGWSKLNENSFCCLFQSFLMT